MFNIKKPKNYIQLHRSTLIYNFTKLKKEILLEKAVCVLYHVVGL